MGGRAGTKSIAAMCKAVVFRFVPTLIEIVALASVLARLFHPALGIVVAVTSVAYTCYTIYMTQVRPAGDAGNHHCRGWRTAGQNMKQRKPGATHDSA